MFLNSIPLLTVNPMTGNPHCLKEYQQHTRYGWHAPRERQPMRWQASPHHSACHRILIKGARMSDPFARIKVIDERRLYLATYRRRISMAALIAPNLERRMRARIDQRFNDLSRERQQLLELIKANPVLRKRLYDQDEAARKAATPTSPRPEKERER